MRSLQRRILLSTVMHSGFHRLFRRTLRGKVIILKYHHIAGPEHQGLFAFERGTTIEQFRRQMRFVKYNCHVVHFEDLSDPDKVAQYQGNSRPLVALTFDDGYLDNFRYAFPVLQELELTATFFISTAYVNTGITFPKNRVKALVRHDSDGMKKQVVEDLGIERNPKRSEEEYVEQIGNALMQDRGPQELSFQLDKWENVLGTGVKEYSAFQVMDWTNLDSLQQAGMTIGAHTVNHRRLEGLTRKEVLDEILGSRDELQSNLGPPITCFAFPDGRMDDVSRRAVADEFALACTSEMGFEVIPPTHPQLLHRVSPPAYFPAFVALMSGLSCWWKQRRFG